MNIQQILGGMQVIQLRSTAHEQNAFEFALCFDNGTTTTAAGTTVGVCTHSDLLL